MNVIHLPVDRNERKFALDSLFDGIGWGAVLITTGILWLMPEDFAPNGAWLIAVGVILLITNAARYATHIEMNGFSLVAGIMAVFAGTGAALHIDLPLFPIALIVIGLCMLVVPEAEAHSESTSSDCHCCQ
jgi:hypothetical protein